MSDLPQSLLVLPKTNSDAFRKVLQKAQFSSVRYLLQAPLYLIPKQFQRILLSLRPILLHELKKDRKKICRVIGSQDVFSSLILLEKGMGSAVQLWEQVLGSLFLELNTLSTDLLWEYPIQQLNSTNQIYRFDPPAKALAIGPLGITIELHSGELKDIRELERSNSPFTALSSNCYFSLFDSNPFCMEEAHPDKEGNLTQLGDHSVSDWVDSLQNAMEVIEEYLPEWWNEFDLYMNRIVPVGFYPQMHLSASYTESPGLAYLSLHPDPLTMAEAIIHESQHSKINILHRIDPIIHNGLSEWTTSPIRPDLRPLWGVLLALHAFVPVAAFHRRLQESKHPWALKPQFTDRRREVWKKNQEALTVLEEKAQMTTIGSSILTGLKQLHFATVPPQ